MLKLYIGEKAAETNEAGKTGYLDIEINLDPYLQGQKSTVSGSKDLNLSSDTLKLLEKNRKRQDTGKDKGFLNRTLFTGEIMPTINKWDLMK